MVDDTGTHTKAAGWPGTPGLIAGKVPAKSPHQDAIVGPTLPVNAAILAARFSSVNAGTCAE